MERTRRSADEASLVPRRGAAPGPGRRPPARGGGSPHPSARHGWAPAGTADPGRRRALCPVLRGLPRPGIPAEHRSAGPAPAAPSPAPRPQPSGGLGKEKGGLLPRRPERGELGSARSPPLPVPQPPPQPLPAPTWLRWRRGGLAAARQPHAAGGAALPGPVRMEAAPSFHPPPPPPPAAASAAHPHGYCARSSPAAPYIAPRGTLGSRVLPAPRRRLRDRAAGLQLPACSAPAGGWGDPTGAGPGRGRGGALPAPASARNRGSAAVWGLEAVLSRGGGGGSHRALAPGGRRERGGTALPRSSGIHRPGKRRENPAGRNKSPVKAGLGGGWEGPNSGGMTPKASRLNVRD